MRTARQPPELVPAVSPGTGRGTGATETELHGSSVPYRAEVPQPQRLMAGDLDPQWPGSGRNDPEGPIYLEPDLLTPSPFLSRQSTAIGIPRSPGIARTTAAVTARRNPHHQRSLAGPRGAVEGGPPDVVVRLGSAPGHVGGVRRPGRGDGALRRRPHQCAQREQRADAGHSSRDVLRHDRVSSLFRLLSADGVRHKWQGAC